VFAHLWYFYYQEITAYVFAFLCCVYVKAFNFCSCFVLYASYSHHMIVVQVCAFKIIWAKCIFHIHRSCWLPLFCNFLVYCNCENM